MSLRDDLDAMERHDRNGTLRQFFEGTASPLPEETSVLDPSAGNKPRNPQRWVAARGD